MEVHRQKFEQFAQRYTGTGKRPTSGTITREFGKKISQNLKSNESDSKKGAEARRFRLLTQKFKLMNCEELGMVDILIVPSQEAVSEKSWFQIFSSMFNNVSNYYNRYFFQKNHTSNQSIPEGYLRVAYVDEFFDIIRSIHCNELKHAGVKKTFKKVLVFSHQN